MSRDIKHILPPPDFSCDIIIQGKIYAQQRHRHTNTGHVYDPMAKEKSATIAQMQSQFHREKPIAQAVRVSAYCYFARPTSHFRSGKYSEELHKKAPLDHVSKPDIDNVLKYYLDCLVFAGILDDDRYVVDCHGHKSWNKNISTSRLEIKIATIQFKNPW